MLAVISALTAPVLAHDPLVNARALVPDAVLDGRYATGRNFTGRALYPFPAAFLRRSTAEKLSAAAGLLRLHGRRLVIYDAYRPLSVQKEMWKARPDDRFVADPERGSSHNRGAAVDAGLADSRGRPVEMPSGFDDFGPGAAHDAPGATPASRAEAARLKDAMEAAGFESLREEWWHYQDAAAKDWPLLDIPFQDLPR